MIVLVLVLIFVVLPVHEALPFGGPTSRRGTHARSRLLVLPAALRLSIVIALPDIWRTLSTIEADGFCAVAASLPYATVQTCELR